MLLTEVDTDIGVAEPGGSDTNDDLAGTGRGIGEVLDGDALGLVENERLQGVAPEISSSWRASAAWLGRAPGASWALRRREGRPG